ncbi:hypothetical protein AVEN_135769-1 [Araneus ventricosus]|uniref:Uncharacterized protein n=1 Tax=Araneus ventricosus TaxID=182803 RepID=A0A4Y2CA79_ARAVE|nr:hypothetical protein AVEN_135769-1 [Araneus ventricosus]
MTEDDCFTAYLNRIALLNIPLCLLYSESDEINACLQGLSDDYPPAVRQWFMVKSVLLSLLKRYNILLALDLEQNFRLLPLPVCHSHVAGSHGDIMHSLSTDRSWTSNLMGRCCLKKKVRSNLKKK